MQESTLEASMNRMADGQILNPGLISARSWWLATMLCRRHSDLTVIEYHPGGGQYDCLGLYSAAARKPVIDLNRDGSIHRHLSGEGSLPWAEAFAGDHFDMVLKLERDLPDKGPIHTQPTSRKLLTYRVFEALASISATERFHWDIRSTYVDTSGHGGGPLSDPFTAFPGSAENRNSYGNHLLGDAAYGFWLLSRQNEPEFMVDDHGILYQQGEQPVDLYKSFDLNGRKLWCMMGKELGRYLA